MNFTINRDVLLNNLNIVSRALSTKVQMPSLGGIKIDVLPNRILLTATNNDISIQTIIEKDFNIIEGGSCILQGKYLLEIIRKLTSTEVDFMSFESNIIQVLSGKVVFTLNELPLDVFPNISFADSQVHFSMDTINLRQVIRKTSFAISQSESRIVLTGVSLTTKDGTLELVATDSFRLARKQIVFENQLPDIKIIVPGKCLDELYKIIEDSEDEIEIHCTSQKILFKYKNVYFQSRLINGVYPNVESLIPSQYVLTIVFNKDELISTIDRVSIFVNTELSNIIKLVVLPDGNVKFISPSNEMGGAIEEVTPVFISNKVSFEVAFSSKFFIDALRSFDSKEVSINLTNEIRPLTITGEFDKRLIQLILPVKA